MRRMKVLHKRKSGKGGGGVRKVKGGRKDRMVEKIWRGKED